MDFRNRNRRYFRRLRDLPRVIILSFNYFQDLCDKGLLELLQYEPDIDKCKKTEVSDIKAPQRVANFISMDTKMQQYNIDTTKMQ